MECKSDGSMPSNNGQDNKFSKETSIKPSHVGIPTEI
jgi:hypothetical protein